MRIFEKKAVKIAEASRTPPSNPRWPPACIVTFAFCYSFRRVECVSSIERTLLQRKTTEVTHTKCFGFVFSRFRVYFSLRTLQFLMVGGKIFFASGRLLP